MGIRLHIPRLAVALAGVGLLTLIAYRFVPVNATTVGFAYLLWVLVVAAAWGFIESVVCALAATVGFNFFFLPPVGTLVIADPHNWVALFSFLATALIASRLSARAQQRTAEAIAHRRDVERLYTFSRAILLIGEGDAFPRQLVEKLAEVFELEAVVLYDRRAEEFHHAGPTDFDGLEEQLRDAALHGASYADDDGRRTVTAVRLGADPIGSLGLQGASMTDGVLQGIANLVAIGLERARAQDLAHQVEAARRSEQLRTSLIDAMAHEFKTPLTSIKAATTSLRADPDQPAEIRAELVEIADEEAEHLRNLINDTVEMAQLDTTHIEINSVEANLEEVVGTEAEARHAEANGRLISVTCMAALEPVGFDRRLVRLAIRQLFDNALKYSPPGSTVTARIDQNSDDAIVEITNPGPGIPAQEQKHVFERFYRSASVKRRIPGTGLGLSIAHSIALAHHGSLSVDSQPGRTTFRLTLPRKAKESQ